VSAAVDPVTGPTADDGERPIESPDSSIGTHKTGERAPKSGRPLLRSIKTAVSGYFQNVGENIPMRPAHVHYPEPPQLAGTVAIKAAFSLCLGAMFGAIVATQIVAAVGNGASVFGSPVSPGFYFPTDFFGWLHFDGANLTREDVASLNAAHVSPGALHAAFAMGINAIGIGIAVGLVLAIAASTRRRRIPRELAGLKGTGEWATYADVKRAGLIWDGEKAGVYLGEFERTKLFGLFARAPVALVYGGPRHILQNAASRSGKDVGTNTYTAIVTWNNPVPNEPGCSILWNDPKGEGHLQTSGTRRALFKNNIVRFAPLAPRIGEKFVDVDEDGQRYEREERFGSTQWNPLAEIPVGTDYEFSDLLQMSTLVVDPTGTLIDSDQGHWIKSSRTIIKALATKVIYDPLEPIKSLSRVADIFGSAGGPISEERVALQRDTDGANAGTIEEMLEQFLGFSATGFSGTPAWLTRSFEGMRMRAEREIMLKRDHVGIDVSEADVIKFEAERRRALDREIERLGREMRHPELERDLRNALRIKGDEASSVYSTVNANLTPWLDPVIIRNTSLSGAKILDLVNRDNPTTWYVVSSIARADMAFPVIKLFWTLAYRKLVPEMEMDSVTKRTKSPWKHNVLFLMNERGSLKKIEVEQEVVPVAASYGMLFDYLFQTPRQLREVGGENDVIGPNCGIQVWHTPQEQEDQEALSKRLGNKTVYIEQVSHSQGHVTRSWQTEQMPLMTPEQTALIPTEPAFDWTVDEEGTKVVARTIRPAYQVVFAPNCPPIYSRKSQWFTNPKLRALINATAAVTPYPLRTDRTREILFAADEQSRTSERRIETTFRSQARVAEAVRLERIDLPKPPPPSVPPDAPDTPPSPPNGGGSSVGTRKRQIVAFDQRVVARARAQEAPAKDVGRGFGSILDGDSRSR
jgi:type IV secretion system protein VirD4